MAHNQEETAPREETHIKTILLVEDDTDIGEVLLQAIVQETPYLAILVADGLAALKAIQGVKPDLFILDYYLPQMNGIELYDKLHTIAGLEHVPAIMLSARLPEQELKKRNILGMHKPIELDEFFQAIERTLKRI
jgi:DNA-binding response OmpR family regulator